MRHGQGPGVRETQTKSIRGLAERSPAERIPAVRPPLVIGSLSLAALLAAAGARWAASRARERELEAAAAMASSAAPEVALPLVPFSLTERAGGTVGLEDLRGRVWVAGFVFSRCPSVCPRLAAVMASLQAPLLALPGGEEARLVAVSVDPAHDTPAVLSRWAEGLQADPRRWLFLTGERATIQRLAEEGFRLPVAADAGPEHPILHSQKLSLVDRQGRVRGWFDPLDDPAERERLLLAAARLLEER